MSKKINFPIKRVVKIISIVLAILVLVFGGPIIINECYKADCGYATKWDASAMLGYYGAILGSLATIVTVIATILFTKKQIQRESFLKRENEKWNKLENTFLEILDGINPIEILKNIIDNGMTDPSRAINLLQKYQMNCKTACDRLNANLNMVDYPKVKLLIDKISVISEEFVDISQLLIKQYSDLRMWQHKDSAFEMLEIEKKRPGTFLKDNIAFNEDILEKIKGIDYQNINSEIAKLNLEFVDAYEIKYREVLQLKGSTFEIIYKEIDSRANGILEIRNKK